MLGLLALGCESPCHVFGSKKNEARTKEIFNILVFLVKLFDMFISHYRSPNF